MPSEVLSVSTRDGRTTAIVQVNELIAEIVVEPEFTLSGEPLGYNFWIRSDGDRYPSPEAAVSAAIQELARMSRVQRVAVVQLAMGDILNAC